MMPGTDTVSMPAYCTACGKAFEGEVYHVYGGHFHPWCVPAPPTRGILDPPIGCICPPGANKECERWDCPRKGIKISATGPLA